MAHVSGTEPRVLEAIDASGCGLRATFVWHRDRFAHTIARVDRGRLIPLLASHEGTESDEWPPSPPLQSLSIEDRGGRTVALLVGMAGRSHWSVSVESDIGEPPSLVFDVACRASESSEQLGSRYRLMSEQTAPSQSHVVEIHPSLRAEAVRVDADAASVQLSEYALAITPATYHTCGATTIRWKYRLTDVAGQ